MTGDPVLDGIVITVLVVAAGVFVWALVELGVDAWQQRKETVMAMPRRPTRAQLRREQADDEADRLAHERPNVPPRPDPMYERCHQSKYGTHRFVLAGDRRIVCEFCGRAEHACRREAHT